MGRSGRRSLHQTSGAMTRLVGMARVASFVGMAAGAGLVALSACQRAEHVPVSATETPPLSAEELRARELPKVITGYQAEQNSVKNLFPRWAIALCDIPPEGMVRAVAEPRMSRSGDARTHGKKMALFYASPLAAYTTLDSQTPSLHAVLPPVEPQPLVDGMYIVKETWTVAQVPIGDVPPRVNREPTYDYIVEGDQAWKRKRRANTFVMYKPPADSPLAAETDGGWIYAVLTPDAKTVIESGKIASCMECHQHAPHERLFGVR